jgi:regulator of nonsense transcripts 1
MPVAFCNLSKSEEKREGSTYTNPVEAEKVLWCLQEVCKNATLEPADVGIVTPYKGQVNLIKRIIKERPAFQKFRIGLEVESVDGFQGNEKEIIIFCAVRNNQEGKVGFLSDWRRLNVMLTRPKRGLIVIGSRSTLNSDPLWKEWLLWATARGAIMGEGAKGTWVPRYLVDDRDGVWALKAGDSGEACPIVRPAAELTVQTEEPEEVASDWEDLGSSPSHSPVASPPSPDGGAARTPLPPLPEAFPEGLLDGIDTEEDGITIAGMPAAGS